MELPLSAAIGQQRLERSIRFLKNLKNSGNQILIFSNKKNFTGDPVFITQNIG